MTDIDLGRETSTVLTEVRTVLSRAETALEDWPEYPKLITKPGEWVRFPEATEPPYCGLVGQESIPHPEADEMKAALEQVVDLLSPWRRTGRPQKERKNT